MRALAFIVIAASMVAVVQAQASGPTYAQYLTAQALAHHPEVLGLTMHVTPPGGANNVIIASNVAPLGKVADEDDLRVIKSQQPLVEVTRAGDRLAVELPLLHASLRPVGVLAVQLAFKPGADRQAPPGRARREAGQTATGLF